MQENGHENGAMHVMRAQPACFPARAWFDDGYVLACSVTPRALLHTEQQNLCRPLHYLTHAAVQDESDVMAEEEDEEPSASCPEDDDPSDPSSSDGEEAEPLPTARGSLAAAVASAIPRKRLKPSRQAVSDSLCHEDRAEPSRSCMQHDADLEDDSEIEEELNGLPQQAHGLSRSDPWVNAGLDAEVLCDEDCHDSMEGDDASCLDVE